MECSAPAARSSVSLDALETAEDVGKGSLRVLADTTHDPAHYLPAAELNEQLYGCMMTLPAAQRACLLLCDGERTHAQIAARLRCPVGTIRSGLHRARAHLRRALQQASEA